MLSDIIARVIAVWEGAPVDILQRVEADVRADWGGDRAYIRKIGEVGEIARTQREEAIRQDYRRGERVAFLARKWRLSARRIQQIVRG